MVATKQIFFLILSSWFGRFKWAKRIQEDFKTKISRSLNSRIDFSSLKVSWRLEVVLRDFKLENKKCHVCVDAKTICIKADIRALLSGKRKIKELSIRNLSVFFHFQKYSGEKTSDPGTTRTFQHITSSANWQKLFTLSYKVLELLPSKIQLINSKIISKFDDVHIFSIPLSINSDEQQPVNQFLATWNKKAKSLHFEYSRKGSPGCHPDMSGATKNLLRSGSASFSVNLDWSDPDLICADLRSELQDVTVTSHLFADIPIELKKAGGEVRIKYSSQELLVKDKSDFYFDQIRFSINLALKSGDRCPVYCIAKCKPLKINELESAFLLFKTPLATMKIKGVIKPELSFVTGLAKMTKPEIKLELGCRDFNVEELGEFDISYLKRAFTHFVTSEGKATRKIEINEASDGFCKLEIIPAILREIITLTEDPGFYSHRGLDKEQFVQAIMENIKYRRFAKGASTITMQVARNLFLGHQKNIARKLEEMVIAFLMENTFRIPKERILEIYLNLIEFSDTSYGITEACRQYFRKEVGAISLEESLIISYIIPRPKFFADAVNTDSVRLKYKLSQHVRFYSRVLFRKKLIQEQACRQIVENFDANLWLSILRENLKVNAKLK